MTRFTLPISRATFALALLQFGCSNESNGVAKDDARTTRDKDATTKAPDAKVPPKFQCTGPGYAGTASDQTVSHVSATVVDESGSPVPHMLAQACGVNVCVNGTTDGNGVVVIDTDTMEQKPAFKYGDGKTHAKFALALGSGSPISVDLGKERTVAFDPPSDGVPMTPGTTASSRGVALTLPAEMNPIKPDPFDFDTPELRNFRAAVVTDPAGVAAVDASLGFGIVVALTPSATELCPAAKLTVSNTASWPAGSRVEFFLHGIDVAEEWAPYGGWTKVSDGTVSADAKSVATADDGGLPALSVVGIRLAK